MTTPINSPDGNTIMTVALRNNSSLQLQNESVKVIDLSITQSYSKRGQITINPSKPTIELDEYEPGGIMLSP